MENTCGRKATTKPVSSKFNFTTRRLQKIVVPAGTKVKQLEYSDLGCTGLKLVLSCLTGNKVFYYRYRTLDSKKKILRIGESPALSIEEAREIANSYKVMIAQGLDPAVERKKILKRPTFKEFAVEVYLVEKKDKKSIADDRRKLENQLFAVFGDMILAEITRNDLKLYLDKVKKRSSNGNYNRQRALLNCIMNMAVVHGVIERNHVASIPKLHEETNHGRALLADEQIRLVNAVQERPYRTSVLAILLLIVTGMRKMECLSLKKSDISLSSKIINLRADNTKGNRARVVPLSPVSIDILTEALKLSKPQSPFLFPGRKGTHIKSVRKTFETAKLVAGVTRYRLHDNRHNFCTKLAEVNVPRRIIQQLSGHLSSAMLERYIHCDTQDTTLFDATNVMSDQLLQNAI
jgi:integrase